MSHIGYPHNQAKPPSSDFVRHGTTNLSQAEDTAKYILDPDDDFARPYLAIPRGDAFIWPLGIEGFEVIDQAELGRHKYLGDIEIDVDITHRAETTITLSGVFPGWTAVDNMQALRSIFWAETPERGKILHLPGVLPRLQYVVGERCQFTHAQDERLQDIGYTASFIKVGSGGKSTGIPADDNNFPGFGTRRFRVSAKTNTLRKIALSVFNTSTRWTQLYANKKNAKWFNSHNISAHNAPDYRLPLGLIIYY